MKKIILVVCITLGFIAKAQIYNAGTILSSHQDINPDSLMHYTYYPYTTQTVHFNVFGNSTIEFLAKGSTSSGGSIALINVKPLDPNLFLSFGRLDSIFDSTSTSWLVTKVAKPLLQGDPINDGGAVWDNSLQYINDHSASFGWTKDVNDWIGDGDKFLGMKYQNGNTTSYGWIRLHCPSKDSCFIKSLSYGNLTTSLRELDKDKVSVFPNPSHTKFTVSVDPFLLVEELCVYNVTGTCVWRKLPRGAGDHEIDLTQQPAGIYQLQLKTVNGFASRKLVKD